MKKTIIIAPLRTGFPKFKQIVYISWTGNLFGSSKYEQDRNTLQMTQLKDKEQSKTTEEEVIIKF